MRARVGIDQHLAAAELAQALQDGLGLGDVGEERAHHGQDRVERFIEWQPLHIGDDDIGREPGGRQPVTGGAHHLGRQVDRRHAVARACEALGDDAVGTTELEDARAGQHRHAPSTNEVDLSLCDRIGVGEPFPVRRGAAVVLAREFAFVGSPRTHGCDLAVRTRSANSLTGIHLRPRIRIGRNARRPTLARAAIRSVS